jgi:hypothetical protein
VKQIERRIKMLEIDKEISAEYGTAESEAMQKVEELVGRREQ